MNRRTLGWIGFTWALAAARAAAQTTNAQIQLAPPYPEIPPGFWEQHGWAVLLGTAGGLLVAAVAVRWLFRARPAPELPAAIRAQRALAPLLNQLETGENLSRASQILRRYLGEVFQLGVGEATTQELLSALALRTEFPETLKQAVAEFLTECDVRKFDPARPPSTSGSFSRVRQLIEQAEASRPPRPGQN